MRFKKDLHKYQIKGFKHLINNPAAALFMEMGLGKTVTTLTAINFLMHEDLDIDSVLIIGPKRVIESVWKEEAKEWDHLKHLTFSKITGSPKQRIEALRKKADIHLISRDNVAWLIQVHGGQRLPFHMLVIDEISSFKNPKSIRFKSLKKVQPFFKRVVGLTGTPTPNGMLDLWSQIYLLDRGVRLGKFISHYRNTYFKPAQRNGNIIYKYQLLENSMQAINNKISDICISMSSEDYLDLPEKIENDIRLSFDTKTKALYDEFEKEQILSIFGDSMDQEITAVNAAALTNKLLQFCNGAVYDEHKNVHEVHDIKIKAAKELIEDNEDKPILIAWTYRHDLYRLKEHLKKYNPRELKTNQDINDWNDGKIKIMLMHPASGGHGLNLQKGGHFIIWFGQTWSLELRQQLDARLHRQGQLFPVIINKLIIGGSMEEKVIRAQNTKTSTQKELMNAVKARIEFYKNESKNS